MNEQDLSPTEDGESLPDRPSKTQRKKVSHDLQKLGLALAALSDARLQALPLDESLRDALMLAKTIRSHEGRRRHMQYVGKLMRRVDAEPLEEAVAQAQLGPAKSSLELHETERWRSELVASDDALTRWIEEHPDTDVTALRQLIRSARKDAAAAPEQRNGRAYRELFQWVKQARQAAASANGSTLADDAADEGDRDD
ncbi:MAG: ribosome biogenesis factor YjgA [Pseudomonadota bacterium]